MGECQICGREIKDNKGLIAHHGFRRPGGGWQTNSCAGARHPSYAKSRVALPNSILNMKRWVESREKYLKKLKEGNIKLSNGRSGPFYREYEPGDRLYEMQQKESIRQVEAEIVFGNREVDRLQSRYDNWRKVE